jgi:diguanylate cyclase (GGDEF)-like protein
MPGIVHNASHRAGARPGGRWVGSHGQGAGLLDSVRERQERDAQTGTVTGGWPHARWAVVLLLGMFLALPVRAADRVVSMQAFHRDQGLGSLAANVLLRDRSGVLWVGTDRGLYRFDGREFIALAREEDPASRLRVNDLHLGTAGQVWVGAAQGLYLWHNGQLRAIATVPVSDLRRMAGDGKGGVYVRHQHRLVHVDAQGRSRAVAWPRALSVGALTDGPVQWYRDRLWTSCGPRLCTRGARGEVAWGAERGVPPDHWITFHVDGDGGLWVGGEHHLLHLPPQADRFRVIAAADPIEMIDTDASGRVLAATAGHISRWDGVRWQTFAAPRALHSAQIRDLRFDPAGAVWVATGGRGVLRWRGYGQFANWHDAQGLDSAPTWAIARDADGRLWLGNQRRGNLLVPGAGHLGPWPAAMRRKQWTNTTVLLAHGRAMWALFNAGTLVRYDLDTRKAQVVAEHLGWTKFALFDHLGRLWIGTHGALWRIGDVDTARARVQRMATGLPSDTNFLGGDLGPGGMLWLATSHGLLRFDGSRFTPMRLPDAMPPGGLADVAAGPRGRLWLAPVEGGLWHARALDAGTLAAKPVGDALIGETRIQTLELDRAGRLWAGSDAGIDVRVKGAWRRLDQGDGLAWADMAAGAFFEDEDGSIWLGTSGGVSHLLHPQRLFPAPAPARPVVLKARYGSRSLDANGKRHLEWSGKALAVTLATPGDPHGGGLAIEYRLEAAGHRGDAWETADSRRLRYASLAPGSYRFQARVYDPMLRKRSPALAFDFMVAPPWWRTGWARIGYALAVLALLFLAWRWRSTGLLRRQARLEATVADRTRELEADKRELEAAHRALEYEATHDALTGLLNRGAAVEFLIRALADEGDDARPLALVLIDLDHFKLVNDTYGHLTGDAVLVQCAQRLRHLAPDGAALGRFGGEELMAVWPGLAGDVDLGRVLAPLLEGDYRDGDHVLRVTCSIGVAWARSGEDVDGLLRRADAALYRAKQAGRARVERADSVP